MKRIIMLAFLTTLFISCGMTKSEGNENISNRYIIEYNLHPRTNPILLDAFNCYIKDLNRQGVSIPSGLINLKLLVTEEDLCIDVGITEGGYTHSSTVEGIIIFNNAIIEDDKRLKRTMYKVLTDRLELGLTSKDSKILGERIQKITEKDYKKLISLIVKEWDKQFIVFDFPEGI